MDADGREGFLGNMMFAVARVCIRRSVGSALPFHAH